MALRLKRGIEADRELYVPIAGELIYTTDTKKLYIGDGSTSGGILVDRGGDWDDLTNKPTIPTDVSDLTDTTDLFGSINSDSYSLPIASPTLLGGIKIGTGLSIDGSGLVTASSGDYNDLTNLPTLFDGAYSSLTGTPTTLAGYGITDAFDGQYSSLSGAPTVPTDVSDLTDTTNLLNADLININIETVSLGRTNTQDQFIPYVITDSVQNTLQDQIPPTNVVGGLIEKVVYSKQLSRYSSGGELLLTLICNTDGNDYYTTRKFVFSRTGTDTYNVTESGAAGATEIYDSIEITQRLDGTDLFLEVTVKAPDSGLPFIRVVGQITYTSVPIFSTLSGF